jgi:hypothetical protein
VMAPLYMCLLTALALRMLYHGRAAATSLSRGRQPTVEGVCPIAAQRRHLLSVTGVAAARLWESFYPNSVGSRPRLSATAALRLMIFVSS